MCFCLGRHPRRHSNLFAFFCQNHYCFRVNHKNVINNNFSFVNSKEILRLHCLASCHRPNEIRFLDTGHTLNNCIIYMNIQQVVFDHIVSTLFHRLQRNHHIATVHIQLHKNLYYIHHVQNYFQQKNYIACCFCYCKISTQKNQNKNLKKNVLLLSPSTWRCMSQ